ncbi:hypothetical protein J2T61_001877 [Methanocalculus sp. AMF5]|uniref:hypothetical protein n=1 Tax=Methanocalculus sp. AMF5 TaxID=1198257 RepID=UPI00209CCBE6|nr:hypothetical protein [Methanocalculus sp. AMF5]MCP1663171.1 hypothetical protein [Methanocalculus sp. AMF5]
MRHEKYRNYILQNVPRLLSQLDRDKNSLTYGCFDRNHWHYKIRDFSSIVLQQGTLALALLYSNNFEGNIYHLNPKIKEWIIASLDYWGEVQLRDGSFNEYWPNEHGYPPTVFSLFSTSESIRLLEKNMPIDRFNDLKERILKSCKFISEHDEIGAQNQEIASIAALYSSYLVTGEEWLWEAVDRKVVTVLSRQSKEGWFSEYGSADIGYLSVSLSFLAEYYRMSDDKRVLPALHGIINFLQYFVHPDGTAGGEYGSRNTEYFLVNGLEILAPEYPLAGAIADKLSILLEEQYKLPDSVDDRYLSHYFLHTYISALLHYRSIESHRTLPCDIETHEKYFEEAKIYVRKSKDYYAIFSLLKGVIKVYREEKELLNDCGYLAELTGKRAVTNWVNDTCDIWIKGDSYKISGHFHMAPRQIIPSVLTHIILRVNSFIFGKSLIPILKKQLITKESTVPIFFQRTVTFSETAITIEDVITANSTISKLSTVDAFSLRYVPSSKYFQSKEIDRIHFNKEYTNIKEIVITKELDAINRLFKEEGHITKA